MQTRRISLVNQGKLSAIEAEESFLGAAPQVTGMVVGKCKHGILREARLVVPVAKNKLMKDGTTGLVLGKGIRPRQQEKAS